jgi:glycosyltransferase involved in cell wall biosynthesis
MKILQIISSGGMYGAESVILNLSRALNQGVHRSFLCVFDNLSNPNLQLHTKAVEAGIDSCLIPCKGQADYRAISRIRALAERTGAEIIHAHGYKADVYAYLAFRNRNIPLVSTCHNWLDEDWRVYLYGMADRYVLRKFARVVAVSLEVSGRLLKAGVKEEHIKLIRNGIDLRPFEAKLPSVVSGSSQHRPAVIGLVGRLSPEKGVDIFLRATAFVLALCPDTRFVIVGEGPERNNLVGLIADLGIGASVSLLGRRENMPAVYRSLDVMVSSSRQEGLPIAILEGMAGSLPVIATAVGEVSTVIRNGETGVLLPPDDPQVLADAIVRLISDSTARIALGSAAKKLIASDYSSERMSSDYLRVYEDAIASASAVGG